MHVTYLSDYLGRPYAVLAGRTPRRQFPQQLLNLSIAWLRNANESTGQVRQYFGNYFRIFTGLYIRKSTRPAEINQSRPNGGGNGLIWLVLLVGGDALDHDQEAVLKIKVDRRVGSVFPQC